ncbi:MAG: hypothetical protein ACRD2Y_05725 [Terriglobales bacterium]
MAQLVGETAQPVIRDIVRSHLRTCFRPGAFGPEHQDVEDVSAEIVLRLVTRLREFKADPVRHPIHNLRGYVAGMAHNACDQYLRCKYPQRARLKNKLRYILTHREGLALWEGEQQRRLCGLALWCSQRDPAAAARTDQLHHERTSGEAALMSRGEAEALKLPELLRVIFERVGAPCLLDDLVSLVANLLGIRDQAPLSKPDPDYACAAGAVSKQAEELAAVLDQRMTLKRVWEEISGLPPRQRAALLLNLRDPQGRGVINLLPLVRVASIREIAQALEMPAEELAGIWAKLPWEDLVIAGFLGVTRQQVINLRKSARERLARRLGSALGPCRGT